MILQIIAHYIIGTFAQISITTSNYEKIKLNFKFIDIFPQN